MTVLRRLARVRLLRYLALAFIVVACPEGGGNQPACAVTGVTVAPGQVTLNVGETATLSTSVSSTNCSSPPPVTWASANPGQVGVTANGGQATVSALAPTAAAVAVSATSGSQTGAALVTVLPLPAIAFTSSNLAFTAAQGGANPASQFTTITNGGGGVLSGLSLGTITYGAGATGWLQAPTLSGTSASPSVTLTLQPVTGSLTPGTYTATVPVQSAVASNSPQNVTVTFTVTAPPPAIALSTSSLSYNATQGGANPASQPITITNSGGGTLSGLNVGTITYGAGATGWLQAPTFNTTTANPSATMTVQPVTGSLTQGTYTATIPVQSAVASNSPRNVTVTFTVAAPLPAIALTPPGLTFNATQGGANPASQFTTITNSGGGTLSGLAVGTVTYGAGATGWLQAPVLSGTTASPSVTLTAQPVTGALAPGSYTATVPVTSGVASNSPQNLTVTFIVAAPPAIALSATSLNYNATETGPNPASQVVTITNSGGGSLSGLNVGTITYGPGATGWLQAPTLSGTTANPSVTLTVQPVTGALVAGVYTATIPVQSGVASNSPQNISVTFTVAVPGPAIALSTTSLSYNATQGGANPASQLVTITNSGTSTLSGLNVGTITYGPGATGWLQAPVLSGTTASPSVTLTVQPVTTGLAGGTYTATIPVQSGVATNSPQNISVTFTVAAAAPAIALSATTLNFTAVVGGANPASQFTTITNSATGTLSGLNTGTITYGAGATGWLQAPTLSSTTANPSATLTVQPVTGALTAGTYTATIPVQSGVATNSPQNLAVNFTVNPAGLDPCLFANAMAISVGQTVNGALSVATSCLLPTGRYADHYRLTLASQTSVIIDLTSTYDNYLELLDPTSGAVIAFDDDGGPGLNAHIAMSLTAGQYIIRARTFSAGVTGPYTLQLQAVVPGVATNVAINAGNAQIAAPGTNVPIPPSVVVLDGNGVGVANQTVTFATVSGIGSITNAVATSDANGIATVGSWNIAAGANVLSATVSGAGILNNPAIFTATGNASAAGFDVVLRFLTMPSLAQLQAFTNAVTRWETIITNDLADIAGVVLPAGACAANGPAINENMDDLVIQVTLAPIDGPGGILGGAGPCFIRTAGALPLLGLMEFDVADLAGLEASGQLGSVILHEMGHVIGIGSMWTHPTFNLLANPSLPASPGVDTRFTGVNGIAGFDAIGGTTYTGGLKVPVENTQGGQGTRDSHWRESVLANELMTGFLNAGANPLSVLTVRSLQDMGYTVNIAAADPFFLVLTLVDAASRPQGLRMLDDVRRGPIYQIDQRGRVTDLQGRPVFVSTQKR